MAYIIRDTGAFIPGQAQAVGGTPQDPQRAQKAAGWLQLANAAAASPLLGALLRGGQAVKHKFEDSALKDAAARKVARERAAVERSPVPLADTGGGFTLQEPEGETIFGKGALSQEPPAPSWLEPKAGADRWDIALPEGDATPTAPAPATSPEAPAGGPAPDVARGEAPGGPAEARAPSAVGIEPEPAPEGSRALADAAWTPPERMTWPVGDLRTAARRLGPLGLGPQSFPRQKFTPPEPEAPPVGSVPPVAEPVPEPTPDYYPQTPEEASWDADKARIHGMLAPETRTPAVPQDTEAYRDTPIAPLAVANDPALRGIETKPPELLNRAIAALEASGSPLARSRAEAIRQELRRREQEAADAQEVEQTQEDDALLAAAPVEVADVWEAAKTADTPEKQAKVLAMIPRARTTVASVEDLIGSGREERLMAQAQQLFPHAPRKSEAELAAELALKGAQTQDALARARDRDVFRDERERLYGAQGARYAEQAESEEALRNEKEETERSKADKNKAAAAANRARADEMQRLQDLKAQLMAARIAALGDVKKLNEAKIKKLLAVARGGGASGAKAQRELIMGLDAYEKYGSINNKWLDVREKEIDRLKTEEAAEESKRLAAERVVSEFPVVGPEPYAKTGNAEADAKILIAWRKELADWEKMRRQAENAKGDITAAKDRLKTLREERKKLEDDQKSARESIDKEIAEPMRQSLERLAAMRKETLGPSRGLPGKAPESVPRPAVPERKKVEL